MPFHLYVGLREIGKVLCHAFVRVIGLPAHDPQRCAADDRVLRRAFNVVMVRNKLNRPVKLGVTLDIGDRTGAAGEHGALTAEKLRVALRGASRIGKRTLLGHVTQHGDVLYVQWRIDLEFGFYATNAVFHGADWHVMPCAEIFNM